MAARHGEHGKDCHMCASGWGWINPGDRFKLKRNYSPFKAGKGGKIHRGPDREGRVPVKFDGDDDIKLIDADCMEKG